MALRVLSIVSISLALFCTEGVRAAVKVKSQVLKYQDIRKELGLSPAYDFNPNVQNVKVAFFDRGYGSEIEAEAKDKKATERYLPASTELVKDYGVRGLPVLGETEHGLQLAQIVWGMLGYPETGPQIRLFNANGPENFILAVKAAKKWGAKVAVCSQNWRTFGNFDGKGFINKAVDEFTDEGGIWVQAAGNDRKRVGNYPIAFKDALNTDGKLEPWLQGPYSSHWFRFRNNVADNEITITASWDSFDPGEDVVGTDDDLDMILVRQPKTGEKMVTIASSNRVQTKAAKADEAKNETPFAREEIKAVLRPSKDTKQDGEQDRLYMIAFRKKGGSFAQKPGNLRITITCDKGVKVVDGKKVEPIDFLDATEDGEIGVPADNRSVITIGDFSPESSRGPTMDGRGKPDILFPRGNVAFNDTDGFFGTSYATAYFAAEVVAMVAQEPRLTTDHILSMRSKNYKKALEIAGWDSTAPWRMLWSNTKVREKFMSFVPEDRIASKLNPDGYYTFGLVGPTKDIALLKTLSEDVRNNLSDYDVYVKPVLTKTFKNEPLKVQGPPKVELVKQGQLIPRTQTGYAIVSNGYQAGILIGTINYTEVVPPQYRTVPGEWQTVPGRYTQVEGDPSINFDVHTRKKPKEGESKILFPFEAYPKQYPREDYVHVAHASVPSTESKGKVTDGSAKQSKLWDAPPSTSELRRIAGGR